MFAYLNAVGLQGGTTVSVNTDTFFNAVYLTHSFLDSSINCIENDTSIFIISKY